MYNYLLRNLSKNTLIYGIGGALRKLSSFLLLPFLTQKISPEGFGIFALLSLINLALVGLSNLGTTNSLSILYFENEESQLRKNLIWSNSILLVITNFFLIGLVFVFSDILSSAVFGTPIYQEFILIAVVGLSSKSISDPFLNYLRMENKPIRYLILVISQTLIFVITVIYFVVLQEQGLYGYVCSITLSQLIYLIICFGMVGTQLPFRFSLSKNLTLIRVGFPSIFGLFAFLIIDYSDRELIRYFMNLEDLGVYSIAYSFGLVALLFVDAFSIAWAPFFNSFSKRRQEAKRVFPEIFKLYLVSSFALALLFFCFSKPSLFLLSTSDFHSGYSLIGIIALAYFCKGIYLIFLPGIYFEHKLYIQSGLEWAAATFNILLNLFLIPRMGILGAAFATLISYIFLCVLTYLVSKRFLKIKLDSIFTYKLLILLVVALGLINYLYSSVDQIALSAGASAIISGISIGLMYNVYKQRRTS